MQSRLVVAASVLIPFAIMVWIAVHAVPSFDGAMNLQVAANIADGHGFTRDYGGHRASPLEIETSGPFLLVAAMAIKVFGLSSFGLLFANLVFVLVLLAVVSVALRPWPALRLVGPAAILLALPQVATWGLGGYGEFASAGLSLAAFVLVGLVCEGHRRPVVLSGAAFLILGTAQTIKVVTVAAVPVALAALALAAYLRPDAGRAKLLASALWFAVPLVAWEAYRLVQVGGWHEWRRYWAEHAPYVAHQASASGGSGGPLHKGADHLHLLAVQTQVPAGVLLLFLLLPFALLAIAFLTRVGGVREWLGGRRTALALQLAALAGLYEIWWLFVTGTDRAWLRRFVIGWLVLALLYLVAIGLLISTWRSRRGAGRPVLSRVAVVALAVVAVGALVVPSGRVVGDNVRVALHPEDGVKTAAVTAAARVRDLATSGFRMCGAGWWSAPVVSLLARVPFCDLAAVDFCASPYREDVAAGRLILVWDDWAHRLVGPSPAEAQNPALERYADVSRNHSLWRFSTNPGGCR